jgi:hypothetical protein
MDHLGLEQADDGLGERVVIRISDAADGGFDPGLKQAVRIPNGHILGPLSLWWGRLPCAGRRSCSACSSGSSTKAARAVLDTGEPMMRRAKTSMTKAT